MYAILGQTFSLVPQYSTIKVEREFRSFLLALGWKFLPANMMTVPIQMGRKEMPFGNFNKKPKIKQDVSLSRVAAIFLMEAFTEHSPLHNV